MEWHYSKRLQDSTSITGFLKGKSEWDEVSILDGLDLFQDSRGQRSKSGGRGVQGRNFAEILEKGARFHSGETEGSSQAYLVCQRIGLLHASSLYLTLWCRYRVSSNLKDTLFTELELQLEFAFPRTNRSFLRLSNKSTVPFQLYFLSS